MQLSNRIRLARPLPTTALHGRAEQLKARGEPVIDLAIALSNHPTPPVVKTRIEQALREPQPMPYTEVVGSAALRQALLDKLRRENGITAQLDEVIVTNGAKQAVYEALHVLTDPGDAVIVFRPYWPANVAIPELLGLRIILAELPPVLDTAALDALPAARAVIFTNPHNPLGRVFSETELACLKDWIGARKMVALVDESYEQLVFEGRHVSLAARCDWRALGVISVFSASQSYGMMGWRAGFALAPAPVVRAMETLQGPITAAVPALTQLAAEAAFASGARPGLLDDYRARRDMAVEMFAHVPWIKLRSPAAGPYLWGDVSALTTDTVAFAEDLLEQEKIALMPGEALGASGHIRLSFISDSPHTLRAGIAGIIRFGERYTLRSRRSA